MRYINLHFTSLFLLTLLSDNTDSASRTDIRLFTHSLYVSAL